MVFVQEQMEAEVVEPTDQGDDPAVDWQLWRTSVVTLSAYSNETLTGI